MGCGPPFVLSYQAPQMLEADLFVNVEHWESHMTNPMLLVLCSGFSCGPMLSNGPVAPNLLHRSQVLPGPHRHLSWQLLYPASKAESESLLLF